MSPYLSHFFCSDRSDADADTDSLVRIFKTSGRSPCETAHETADSLPRSAWMWSRWSRWGCSADVLSHWWGPTAVKTGRWVDFKNTGVTHGGGVEVVVVVGGVPVSMGPSGSWNHHNNDGASHWWRCSDALFGHTLTKSVMELPCCWNISG